MAAGDVDSDRRPDLVVTGFEAVSRSGASGARRGAVAAFSSAGDGFRPGRPLCLDGYHPRDVAVGDLDGDGKGEVVVLDGPTAVVLRDRGGELQRGPRLQTPAGIPSSLGQWRLALADVDGDGWTDVVTSVATERSGASSLVLHRNDGAGGFVSSVLATIDGSLGGVVTADFDGDGDVDVVAIGTEQRMHVLRNRGDGRFDAETRPRRRVGGEKLLAADGRLDLVVSAEYSSEAARYPGDLWVRPNLGGFAVLRGAAPGPAPDAARRRRPGR